MRSFLLACAAVAAIAIVATGVLNAVQEPVSVAFATSAVRL